jgi:hypothetical protein
MAPILAPKMGGLPTDCHTAQKILLIGTSATNMFCIYHRGWILKRICGFDLKWVPNAPLRTFGQGYIALRFPPTFQGSEIHYL